MQVRIWGKRETQTFVTRLRRSGYNVERVLTGYTCFHEHENGDNDCVFSTLEGRKNYIVRLNDKYLQTV